MANIDAPFGLRPVRHLLGVPLSMGVRKFNVASGYGYTLFVGDPVTLAGSSYTGGHYPTVTKATAGDGYPWIGAIVGVEYNPEVLTRKHILASTGGFVFVQCDPYVVYEIQDDGNGTVLDADAVGLNAVFIYTHSGSTVTGLSGVELDTSSDVPAADASNQMLILGVANRPNNALGAHCVWEVLPNMHKFKSTGDANDMLGV